MRSMRRTSAARKPHGERAAGGDAGLPRPGALLMSVVFTGKDPGCRACRDGYPVCWLGVFERLEADLCARHLARWVHIAQLEREVLDRPEEAESRAREWQPGWPPTPPKGPGGGSHQHTYPRGRGVGGQCTICGRNSWEGS